MDGASSSVKIPASRLPILSSRLAKNIILTAKKPYRDLGELSVIEDQTRRGPASNVQPRRIDLEKRPAVQEAHQYTEHAKSYDIDAEGDPASNQFVQDQAAKADTTGESKATTLTTSPNSKGESLASSAILVKRKPRPSLSERTIQTLSQIPPSPSSVGKKSGFLQSESPTRLASIGKRGMTHLHSLKTPDMDARAPPFASSPNPKATVPASGIRKNSPNGGRHNVSLPQSRLIRTHQRRHGGDNEALSAESFLPSQAMERPRRPSPISRASRSPSPSLKNDVPVTRRPKQLTSDFRSVGRPSDSSTPSGAADSNVSKSSMALRETVAKAKAARREAMKKGDADCSEGQLNSLNHSGAHPDLRPNDPVPDDLASGRQSLRARIEVARTEGRLNISALGLQQIPEEVLNMYRLEQLDASKAAWYESVDLVRLSAADNELKEIDPRVFPEIDLSSELGRADQDEILFGGLEYLDLHRNRLQTIPPGLRCLTKLTHLNLSHNQLTNECMNVIVHCKALRDLNLSHNQLSGDLDSRISRLVQLGVLDISGNSISGIPESLESLVHLRTLNISGNRIVHLPFESLVRLPLADLRASDNKLGGILLPPEVVNLDTLQYLDVSNNQLTALYGSTGLEIPSIRELYLSRNQLTSLPSVSSLSELLTLDASANRISQLPAGLANLQNLKQANFNSNEIREIDPYIGLTESLTTLDISGNPLRRKRYLNLRTEALKEELRLQLEPLVTADSQELDRYSREDDSDCRGNDGDKPGQETWPVGAGGILDRSSCGLETVEAVILQATASDNDIRVLVLRYNRLSSIPSAVSTIVATLTELVLSHNQFDALQYLNTKLDLLQLAKLDLSCTSIAGFEPLLEHLSAPRLFALDVSANRITTLPPLRETFPSLTQLIANDNNISDLTANSIRGLNVIDLRNNNIGHLPPHLGLIDGIDRLELAGNRFRVPSWNVLSKGTKAILAWLKDKIPINEREDIPSVDELD